MDSGWKDCKEHQITRVAFLDHPTLGTCRLVSEHFVKSLRKKTFYKAFLSTGGTCLFGELYLSVSFSLSYNTNGCKWFGILSNNQTNNNCDDQNFCWWRWWRWPWWPRWKMTWGRCAEAPRLHSVWWMVNAASLYSACRVDSMSCFPMSQSKIIP